MTEAQWLDCAEPGPMLEFLRGRASERKLRLFACAYARTGSWLQEFSDICFAHFYEGWGRRRQIIDTEAAQEALLALRRSPDGGHTACIFRGKPPLGEVGEKMVALAERFADGLASTGELQEARQQLEPLHRDAREGAAYCGPSAFRPAEEYALLLATLEPSGQAAAEKAVASAVHAFVAVADGGPRRGLNPAFRAPVRQQTLLLQAELLREAFGNPFRPPVVQPAWRTSGVLEVARSIEQDQGFDSLAVLADALEDAGCRGLDVLAHCRKGGPHTRGCWALDAVLGKM